MGRIIAVAGKGGTGKSTIAALLILGLQARGRRPVLAIDADADANLGRLLGIKPEQTVGDLREEVLKTIKDFPAGMSKAQYLEAGLHSVIEETPGFDLITMGRGEGAGCYCYLNSLIRKFSEDLAPLYPWIVIDNEAGLEHISRRIIGDIDTLFIVINNSPLAMDSARNIQKLTVDLENRIRKKYVVTNMLREKHKPRILEELKELNVEYLCDVPFDPALEDMILENNPLTQLTDSPVLASINTILETIGG